MRSYTTAGFLKLLYALPTHIQLIAFKNYRLWKNNHSHPSIDFKRIGTVEPPVYSVRVGIGWRALGYVEKECIYWFWIGSHAHYDRLLKQFR